MAKKFLNDRKMLLVIIGDNSENIKKFIDFFTSNSFKIPAGLELKTFVIENKKNLAKFLNKVQELFDAKYKIYLQTPVDFLNETFFEDIFNAFYYESDVGMLGLLGSEMPIDGDYTKAENFYGKYAYLDDGGKLQYYRGKIPLHCQSVHILESSFFATCEDIAWDENIGEDFLFVAQCLRYRKAGYNINIIYQQFDWIHFSRDNFSYNFKENQTDFENQLKIFQKNYRDEISPLVSILIPTYNQPKFVLEALESALGQTYPNIEILVGDDSTNEDTKNLIQPYLKKYKNLKYFYHNGKIPRGGRANYVFLSNHCHGEFVNFLFHDDLLYPKKISKMMSYYVRDLEEKISLVTSTRDLIDENTGLVGNFNYLQFSEDTILSGEKVGRRLIFGLVNFIGELTTVLLRKNSLKSKDMDGNISFMFGGFGGVFDVAFGDVATFLNVAKSSGNFVFIAESLSAFRRHSAQNTHKPWIRFHLVSDNLNFITLAWINNLFLRNSGEYLFACKRWLNYLNMIYSELHDDEIEEHKKLSDRLLKVKAVVEQGNYEKILDASISFLLENLPEKNPILKLVRKNRFTGCWEKAEDNIMTCVFQNDY